MIKGSARPDRSVERRSRRLVAAAEISRENEDDDDEACTTRVSIYSLALRVRSQDTRRELGRACNIASEVKAKCRRGCSESLDVRQIVGQGSTLAHFARAVARSFPHAPIVLNSRARARLLDRPQIETGEFLELRRSVRISTLTSTSPHGYRHYREIFTKRSGLVCQKYFLPRKIPNLGLLDDKK